MSINGYKVSFVSSISEKYNHKFGGNDWQTPICKNCGDHYHQILSLDLRDTRLNSIIGERDVQLPLISCLNCSSNWGEQIFKIDFENKQVIYISDSDVFRWVENENLKLTYPLPEFPVSLEELSSKEFTNIINDFGNKYFIYVLGFSTKSFSNDVVKKYCPICGKEMMHVAIIGSDYGHVLTDYDFIFGEQWLYYFFCPNCKIMKVIGQSS